MFNNANVIFRTKFVDGSSTVSRTVNAGAVALLKAKDKVVLAFVIPCFSFDLYVICHMKARAAAAAESSRASACEGENAVPKKRGKQAAADSRQDEAEEVA
jgi:hypothetical protein